MVENIAKSYSEVDVILSKLDRRYYNKMIFELYKY